ncbi:radical SAM protein [Streptomyces virginiae]|uniref:radical SAM protein n=1 Tax=Streptomyces virginiae TaxID=1961 RepID=UPI003625E51F
MTAVQLEKSSVLESFTNSHLNLILLPTERCNLRCTYCYEDFKIGRMPAAVVSGVKSLLEQRSPGLSNLEISWFGGEPLLARDIVSDISRHALTLAKSSGTLSYASNMTTNGVLLGSKEAEELASLGVNFFQISLDGLGPVHDTTRATAGGSGSFAKIWGNLLTIRNSEIPVKIMLRVHFSPDNHSTLDPLIESINAEFANDRRFFVYFKAVERLGGPRDEEIRRFERKREKEVKQSLIEKLKREDQSFEFEGPAAPYICYASKPNSIVIRADGRIGKCTVALSDERNTVGVINEDGTLSIDQDKLRPWLRGFSTLDSSDLACPLAGMNPAIKAESGKEY